MRIDFDEQVSVPPEVVFDYLRSPTEWPRLYGALGEVRDLGEGWYAVPMAGTSAALEARMTSIEKDRHAAWDLRGMFAGKGEVILTPSDGGTRITGFEEVTPAGVDDAATLSTMTQAFEAIWQLGWDRLRSGAQDSSS